MPQQAAITLSLQLSPGRPLELSRVEPGHCLMGNWVGTGRGLERSSAHPMLCVGPSAPV